MQRCFDPIPTSAGFVQNKDPDPLLSFVAVSGLDLRLPTHTPSTIATNLFESNTSHRQLRYLIACTKGTLSQGLMLSLPLQQCSQNLNAEKVRLGSIRHPLNAKSRLSSAHTILMRRLVVVLRAQTASMFRHLYMRLDNYLSSFSGTLPSHSLA